VNPRRRGSPRPPLVLAALAIASAGLLLTAPPLEHAATPPPRPAGAEHAFPDPWGDLLAETPTARPVASDRRRITEADLLAAPVPSLCGHPAGTLVDGRLPGIPPGEGVVWIFVDESGRIPAGRVAYGDLGPDVGNGAAVAVYCDRGGASWPEAVVLYGPGPTYLGHVVLSDLTPGRQSVVSLAVADGVVRVGFVNSWAADEVGRRGRVDGTVALTLVGGEVRAGDLRLVDERPTADQAVAAAVAGDTAELGEVALADAATALVDLVARLQAGGVPTAELAVGPCTSPLAGAPEQAGATCVVEQRPAADPAAVRQLAHLHLSRTGFATWQVVASAT